MKQYSAPQIQDVVLHTETMLSSSLEAKPGTGTMKPDNSMRPSNNSAATSGTTTKTNSTRSQAGRSIASCEAKQEYARSHKTAE